MRVESVTKRSLVCPRGEATCFQIGPISHEGMLHKVVCVQVGGPVGRFKVDIFNTSRPCTATSGSSGGADEEGYYEASTAVYRVIPQLDSDSSGFVAYYDSSGMPYINVDSAYTATNPVRALWVKITPDNPSNDTSYDLNLTVTTSDP